MRGPHLDLDQEATGQLRLPKLLLFPKPAAARMAPVRRSEGGHIAQAAASWNSRAAL